MTPVALARKVDGQLATLSKATLSYTFEFSREEIGRGMAACLGHIVSPKKFFVQVARIDPKSREAIVRERWIADGNRFGAADEQVSPPQPKPFAQRPAPPAHPLSVWYTDFGRVILSGLGRPTHPFETFLKEAASNGYKITARARTFTYKGQKRSSYQLVVYKGVVRYETVIDGRGFVPVSVMNTIGPKTFSRWFNVEWNLRPGKTLNVQACRFVTPGPMRRFVPRPPLR